jgi:hypothetical protein
VFNRIQKILRRKKIAQIKDVCAPTEDEWKLAKNNLKKAERNANFAELGGFKPNKKNRATSWWGGNFLGFDSEAVPICKISGRKMHPVLQLRVDELPYKVKALKDVALLTLWFDLKAEGFFEAKNGCGFEIRTYCSLEGLIPLGPGYREHETFPTFPIRWHGLEGDIPDWESFDGAPTMVMRSADSEWFDNHPSRKERAILQQTMPVKVGGYAQWWQSPKNVENGTYVFFVDTTMRGKFGFPGGGNGNFFRTNDGWELRVDFT